MRWTYPERGTKRIRTFFAWTPVDVDRETRWLERVTVEEEYCHGIVRNFWRQRKFIDETNN